MSTYYTETLQVVDNCDCGVMAHTVRQNMGITVTGNMDPRHEHITTVIIMRSGVLSGNSMMNDEYMGYEWLYHEC